MRTVRGYLIVCVRYVAECSYLLVVSDETRNTDSV